jgi:hypothetical protein
VQAGRSDRPSASVAQPCRRCSCSTSVREAYSPRSSLVARLLVCCSDERWGAACMGARILCRVLQRRQRLSEARPASMASNASRPSAFRAYRRRRSWLHVCCVLPGTPRALVGLSDDQKHGITRVSGLLWARTRHDAKTARNLG